MAESILFLLLSYFLLSVTLGNPVLSKFKTKREVFDVCKDVLCSPGYQCCEDTSEECGGEECEKCIDGTYSAGGSAHCENCGNCEIGTEVIESCTLVMDTVCSGCPSGTYRHSSGICRPCSSCSGEVDCADICSITTTPAPPPIQSTTVDNPTMMTKQNTDKLTTTTAAVLSTTKPEEELSKWDDTRVGIIVGIILATASLVAIAVCIWGCVTKVFCCWTEKSKNWWADKCPCCCGPPTNDTPDTTEVSNNQGNVTLFGDNNIYNTGNITLDPRLIDGTSNNNGNTETVSPSDITTTLSDQDEVDHSQDGTSNNNGNTEPVSSSDPERVPLMNLCINGQNNVNSEDNKSVTRKKKKRTPSSLSDVPECGLPEDDVFSSTSNTKYELPKWCLNDTATVSNESISEIAKGIGKRGVILGRHLGLKAGEIEIFEHDYKTDLSRQNVEILQLWMGKKGVNGTKSALAKGLIAVGRTQVAEYLWPDYFKPVSPTTTEENVPFVQRRESTASQFEINLRALKAMDWTKGNTWTNVTQQIIDNDLGNFKSLALICTNIEYFLPDLPPMKECRSVDLTSSLFHVDVNAYNLMSSDLQQHLQPIFVPVDSNCLFSAASVIAYGSIDHCCELRLRTMIELCNHKDYYLQQNTLKKCIDAENALILCDAEEIEANFKKLVRDTLKKPAFSLKGKSIQLFGLASVLGCNILSVYPTRGAKERSQLNVLIPPRDKKIKDPVTECIMWTMDKEVDVEEDFLPNHFVPLLRK